MRIEKDYSKSDITVTIEGLDGMHVIHLSGTTIDAIANYIYNLIDDGK